MDQGLKFRKQAASAIARARKVMGATRKSFQKLDHDTLPILCRTMVCPRLEYCNAIWGPLNRVDQILVERIQRRAAKLVPSIKNILATQATRTMY